MIARAGVGVVLAAVLVTAAVRRGTLSPGGAAAALPIGTLAAAAGWDWAALLLAFFLPAAAVSALGAERKRSRTGAIVAKGGPRDAAQVVANGGAFALAAVGWLASPSPLWNAAAAGALAAAAADTWGTEIGLLSPAQPRSLATWRVVSAGTSGGVTAAGLGGAAAAALLTGAVSIALGWGGRAGMAAVAGGLLGAVADSLAGALAQGRRRCERCGTLTERTVHGCGKATVHCGGFRWLDNDGVNALATLVGAAAAVAIANA
ncbi:MAG TPA: DUF92 domain-containing protein [Gemmatimonadaceae bacterium]|nr:DUF92 domain-containing protein [Gemmatimonadaceae bacterium]